MPHLEQWTYQRRPIAAEYTAPEQITFILTGDVTGHPKLPDGQYIETSRVIEIGTDTVTTKTGSVYTLGEPWPDYEAQYPNAKARLFAQQED